MITIRNVGKSFGTQTLLEDATLQINPQDRYALIGPNGSGKSTLFKMLLGQTEPDSGEIQVKRGLSVGYLPQDTAPMTENNVIHEALSFQQDPDNRTASRAKAILMGLGFKVSDFERPVKSLSGGWSMRVAMARLLLEGPDLLLLDEPTNHLDLECLLWFQNTLQNYQGAIFMISHDRSFINHICKTMVCVQEHKLKTYAGNYDFFLQEKASEEQRLETAYRRQQEEIEQMQEFISRNRVRASTASRAQNMIKRLEKMEKIELPENTKKIRLRFPQPERSGIRVLALKNVHKSYGPIEVYKDLNFEMERGWKIALVGPNGAGKSTLLKILAGVIPFDEGERVIGLNSKVGYFSQTLNLELDPDKTVMEEAANIQKAHSEQTLRNVLGSFLFKGEAVYKKVSFLSGGEKSRLALAKILLDPPNVLLMDEPTTHLDLTSLELLTQALREFEGTLCFISHDVHFLNSVANHVFHVSQGSITIYPGNYEYFQRRQSQMQSDSPPDVQPQNTSPKPKGMNPKQARRERALERERLAGEKRKKSLVAQISTGITTARSQIESLSKELENQELYQDYSKVKNLSEKIAELQKEIQSKEFEIQRLNQDGTQPHGSD